VRAFVLSADLFPPNLARDGVMTTMSHQIAVDPARMQSVIDFILQKRGKDDVVLLFDGRSRPCRKIMENNEDKMAASGAHTVNECWLVYVVPSKSADIRVPARQTSFASNNKEVAFCVVPAKRGSNRIVQRAEFNSCGEISTSSPTYTGVHVRRFSELPRMDQATKSSILGVAAAGAVKSKRAQQNVEVQGHPFSYCEVKPLNLWQRICEHHRVTHIVDFSAGSGTLALAASGTMEYEGIAGNAVHSEWLDSTLDRCSLYLAGKNKEFAKKLGGDDDFLDKVEKYLSGTMMEARRLLEPGEDHEGKSDDESSECTDNEVV
jgi:hypothetical protein